MGTYSTPVNADGHHLDRSRVACRAKTVSRPLRCPYKLSSLCHYCGTTPHLDMSAHKVALITGCSDMSSLGAAMALELLLRGWKVFATALEVDTMVDLQQAGCTVCCPPAYSESRR